MENDLNDENQPPKKKRKIEGMGELLQWEHFSQPLDLYDVVIHYSLLTFLLKTFISCTHFCCNY